MIALCPNPFRDNGLALTLRVRDMLKAEGFDSIICPVYSDDASEVLPAGLEYSGLEHIETTCSLAVVIGGDGTILSVVRALGGGKLPVLGVNLGTKGFMTALEPEELELIAKAAKGEYFESHRMMIDVKLRRRGEFIYSDRALNDVVIHGYGDCVNLTAWCNGAKITNFSGDGIILATPTGSTGYSMSAGGPIVEPDAENIILSPICAHVMGMRSFVLSPERSVRVLAEKLHNRRAYLSVDGNWAMDLENGDEIVVTKSPEYTIMANMGLRSFYEIAYDKLTR